MIQIVLLIFLLFLLEEFLGVFLEFPEALFAAESVGLLIDLGRALGVDVLAAHRTLALFGVVQLLFLVIGLDGGSTQEQHQSENQRAYCFAHGFPFLSRKG